jgi:hypothetical protein
MKIFVALLTSGLVFPGTLLAADFAPKLDEICSPSPVTATSNSRVSPDIFFDKFFTKQELSNGYLDKDHPRRVTYEDRVAAMLSPAGYCSNGRCSDEGKKALPIARATLINYFSNHRQPIRDGEAGYQFTFEVTAENVRAFLLEGKGAPACIVPPPPPGQSAAKKPPKQDETRIPTRVMVRKNIADLHVGQGDEAFKGIDRASLSIKNDINLKSTAYDLDAVLGVGFGQFPITSTAGTYLEFIPYFTFKRQQTTGNTPPNAADVYNIGGGIMSDMQFNTGPLGNDFQFATNYVNSQRSGARVASGSLVYAPYPEPIAGISRPAVYGPISVMLTPQLKYIYGSVLADGGDPNLVGTNSFQRYGGRTEFALTVDDGTLEGMGVNLAFDYLTNSSPSPVKKIVRFEGSTSYTLPKQKLWSVVAKYINGRDLDTLENEQKWSLGVGFKY